MVPLDKQHSASNCNLNFCLFLPDAALGKFTAGLREQTVSVTQGSLVPWDTTLVDLGGYFNTSSGLYTAPTNGLFRSASQTVDFFLLFYDLQTGPYRLTIWTKTHCNGFHVECSKKIPKCSLSFILQKINFIEWKQLSKSHSDITQLILLFPKLQSVRHDQHPVQWKFEQHITQSTSLLSGQPSRILAILLFFL